MNKLKSSIREIATLIVGEIIVSLLVIGGFFLFGPFKETSLLSMIIGVSVGSLIIILNYLFLILTVNRLINEYLALRGNSEMTPEEILDFTTKHSMKIQNAIKISFLVRLITMVGALVAAFVFIEYINPIATVIPILAYRVILTVGELIRRKFNNQPNPENFILYNTEADGYEEIDEDDESSKDSELAEDSLTALELSAESDENYSPKEADK